MFRITSEAPPRTQTVFDTYICPLDLGPLVTFEPQTLRFEFGACDLFMSWLKASNPPGGQKKSQNQVWILTSTGGWQRIIMFNNMLDFRVWKKAFQCQTLHKHPCEVNRADLNTSRLQPSPPWSTSKLPILPRNCKILWRQRTFVVIYNDLWRFSVTS